MKNLVYANLNCSNLRRAHADHTNYLSRLSGFVGGSVLENVQPTPRGDYNIQSWDAAYGSNTWITRVCS